MKVKYKAKIFKTKELLLLSEDFIKDKIEYVYYKLRLENVKEQILLMISQSTDEMVFTYRINGCHHFLPESENDDNCEKLVVISWEIIFDLVEFVLSISELASDAKEECPGILAIAIKRIIQDVAYISFSDRLENVIEFYLREDYKNEH